MKYHIELMKTIVVTVEADSEADARIAAFLDPSPDADGAWQNAEPQFVCVAGTSES